MQSSGTIVYYSPFITDLMLEQMPWVSDSSANTHTSTWWYFKPKFFTRQYTLMCKFSTWRLQPSLLLC